MKLHSFILNYPTLFSLSFLISSTGAQDINPSMKEEIRLENSTEIKVRETFPLYRVDFNHKAVQEKVYNEFLKELKEKEKLEDSSQSNKKP